MAPPKWDAYRSLNITSRDSDGMTCVGNTKYGNRCRWDILDKRFSKICSMLDDFETKAPADALPSLGRLAELSLCEDYHQGQIDEKAEEWEIAIEEATQFYESGLAMRKRNRKLMEILKEEIAEKVSFQQKYMEAIKFALELSKSKETESKEAAQEVSNSYEKRVTDMDERISKLQAERKDEYRSMTAMLEKEAETNRSIGAELGESNESRRVLDNQVSELSLQLENKVAENSTLQSELDQIKIVRDQALSERDELRSQLETASEDVDRIGISLQETEAAMKKLSEEKQRFHLQLSTKDENFKTLSDEKAQLEEKYAGLVQEVETVNTQLSSEQHNAAKLRQSLQTATEDLSSTHTQLKTVNKGLSTQKDELEKLQVELVQAREVAEEERQKLIMHQAVSRDQRDELIQEMTCNKLHPFEAIMEWVKSLFRCFGRLKTRKTRDLPTVEENMPSP